MEPQLVDLEDAVLTERGVVSRNVAPVAVVMHDPVRMDSLSPRMLPLAERIRMRALSLRMAGASGGV